MSGLFDSLSSASRALTAARLGLDVAGQNIANINTPGYSRRTLVLAEAPPTDGASAGRGVDVVGIRALRDVLAEARLRREQEGAAASNAIAQGMAGLEAALGAPGQGLDAQISSFFDSFSALADDPSSLSARDGVLTQAAQLTQAFHQLADRFAAARRDANTAIEHDIQEINQLATEVARLNDGISTNGADVEALKDQRAVALSRLSELAGVTVTTRDSGGVDVSIGQGRPLVIGTSTYQVTAPTSGPFGLSSIVSGGLDLTSEVTGGEIGGLLQFRDSTIPGYQARLDTLASDLAAAVNTAHQTGFDLSGTAGGAFFTPLGGVTGAASALSVDAAVAADGGLIAASGTGAVGDNAIARALANLRAAPVVAWGDLQYRFGADLAGAQAATLSHGQVIQQLEQLRAQAAGVSLDEEAANLMRFQRAYQANARYFTTISDTLDSLMAMVR